MKKRGKLTGFFSGFAPISPKSAEKQHEKVLSASRKRQVPHYANHGAAPVILSRSAKRAKKSGPVFKKSSTSKWQSAKVGKSVPCLKWGGWSGEGGHFKKGVYGLVNARQVPELLGANREPTSQHSHRWQ